MRRPDAVPHECRETAQPAPHASEGVGQSETKESLGLPHLPHLPHRVSATGGEKHRMRRKTESLAALADRWEARTAARQAAAEAPRDGAPKAVQVASPAVTSPPAGGRKGKGLTEAASCTPATTPPANWWRLPCGEERGRAFTEARALPGACPSCAGRRWWREPDEASPGRCATCRPPPPGLAFAAVDT